MQIPSKQGIAQRRQKQADSNHCNRFDYCYLLVLQCFLFIFNYFSLTSDVFNCIKRWVKFVTNLVLLGFNSFLDTNEVENVIGKAIKEKLGDDVYKELNVCAICDSHSHSLAEPEKSTPYIVVEGDHPDKMKAIAKVINEAGYDIQISKELMGFLAKPL